MAMREEVFETRVALFIPLKAQAVSQPVRGNTRAADFGLQIGKELNDA
jgi:hypothetical protein